MEAARKLHLLCLKPMSSGLCLEVSHSVETCATLPIGSSCRLQPAVLDLSESLPYYSVSTCNICYNCVSDSTSRPFMQSTPSSFTLLKLRASGSIVCIRFRTLREAVKELILVDDIDLKHLGIAA